MSESLDRILTQTEPGDSEFREITSHRQPEEHLGAHLERILSAMNIKIEADQEDIASKLESADIIISNHPTSFDIVIVGALLGDAPYTVVTQRKRGAALKKLFGDETIYPVPLHEDEYREFVAAVKQGLSDGRKLVLFPSGGSEIKDGGSDAWFDFYKNLLKSDTLLGKRILPLRIDTSIAKQVQSLVGDKEKGREIFPEIHYTIPTEPIMVSVEAGEVFDADELAEGHYREAFRI